MNVRGAVPGTLDPALPSGAPQSREQLQYGGIDFLHTGTVDHDRPTVREASCQRAVQAGGLHDREARVELDARRLTHARRFFLAHAAAVPGSGWAAVLFAMSPSMSSKISIL